MPADMESSAIKQKKRVLIIGSGTGATTAHMMEDMHDTCQVTLVDSRDRLGGHINTLKFSESELIKAAGKDKEMVSQVKKMAERLKIWLKAEELKEINQVNKSQLSRSDKEYRIAQIKAVYTERRTKPFVSEGGAEFIGPEDAYPNVHRLFKQLGVRLDEYAMSTHIHPYPGNHMSQNDIKLPPFYPVDEGGVDCGCLTFFSAKKDKPLQNRYKIDLTSLLDDFPHLINLKILLCELTNKVNSGEFDQVPTLEEFIAQLKRDPDNGLSNIDQLANEVIYPIVAAAWGVNPSEAKQYMAHYSLNYLALGQNWFDAPHGLSSYIDNMHKQWTHCDVRYKTEVKKLIKIPGEDFVGYHAKLSDGTLLCDKETSQPIVFDDVVIATPVDATKDILPGNIDELDLKTLKEKLAKVRYFDTKVVFHLDRTYETPAQTVVHTRLQDGYAANTAQKDWKSPVMKTWVLSNQRMPKEDTILSIQKYKHPHMDRHYLEAQKALRAMQNTSGLHLGGILAGLGDSHEDAITVALQTAKLLSEKYQCLNENTRLKPLLDNQQRVSTKNIQLGERLAQAKREHTEKAPVCC